MKSVLIFRHIAAEGPGYFAQILKNHGLRSWVIAVDQGEPIPCDLDECSGLVFMGGPMSVNDPLPWIEQELSLIRKAVVNQMPTLVHCLGGQLISKALGGTVTRNTVKEIGWHEVESIRNGAAVSWLKNIPDRFTAFHWHGETFTIPPGATGTLGNKHCANQGFAMGKHLGMQCHIEMTEEMVREWCDLGEEEIASASASPAVQQAAEILVNLAERVNILNAAAQKIYSKWIEGLVR